ncbi:MAG: ABC transporter ATP-binding protein, partial [Armatimonadetes bacterium]|nr:ABC transporter ATP-binding protein [Armatimonadota bacterium]
IKVYTVGIGTPEGTFLTLGGRSIWVRLDEETLKEVAEIGGGRYFHASSTMELRQVYRQLGRTIGWERKPTDVSALAAVGALLLTAASLVLSRGWLHPLG